MHTSNWSSASEYIQFSRVNTNLYQHCFKLYNEGVKVKEAIRRSCMFRNYSCFFSLQYSNFQKIKP